MGHTISIIVVTLNEERHLARLKAALDALVVPAGVEMETILVDGGSTDRTVAIGREKGFTRVVALENASIPVCRNRGVAAAAGDLLAFVDGDCEPSHDWIEVALPWLEETQPTVVGWPVVPPEPMSWVQRAWHAHWTHKNLNLETHGGRPCVLHESFRLITTRNMLLNRQVFDQLHGFDELLPTGEDTDFAFRAYIEGLRVVAVPALKVVHHGEPRTLAQFFGQQVWHANRRSFRKIIAAGGVRVGANAVLFSALFAASLLLAAASPVAALVTRSARAALLLTPMMVLLCAPSIVISWRARDLSLIIPLCVLYGAYGLARLWDLVRPSPKKPNWKPSPPSTPNARMP
ncbi:MAG: glycosyltransferase [Kiritimatiellae bacterium]|nr:glycosyltransferase [Kiritimatiellia bacterium]